MRLMYDGINTDAHLIPATAQLVAGYVDGLYAWSAADWARFPNAVKVRIAVFATTDDGHVLDCEPGNATPAESVDWVLMRRKAGVDPTVYCGKNTWWGEIRAAFQARGVPEPHYWVADYSVNQTSPAIPAGAIALQYTDTGPYDLSVVADHWPGIDPKPAPPSTPEDTDMILHSITGSTEVWALSGGLYWHVADPASLGAYHAAGIPQVTVSAAEHQDILGAVSAVRAAPATLTLDAASAAALGTAIAAAIKLPATLTLTGTETVTETGKLA